MTIMQANRTLQKHSLTIPYSINLTMKLKYYFFPNFEVKIRAYEANRHIEFTGNNNWHKLLYSHIIVLSVSLIFYISFLLLPSKKKFLFLIATLFLFALISFSYQIFKTTRKKKYLKEEIIFNKTGIILNHTKQPENRELIKAERLNNLKLISDGRHFKFVLPGHLESYFEFSVEKGFKSNKFIDDILVLLELKVDTWTNLGSCIVFELTMEEKTKSKSLEPFDSHTSSKEVSELNSKKEELKKRSTKYKPKTFYSYNKNGIFIIEEKTFSEARIAQKLKISRSKRVLWYYRFGFYKIQFKFTEIKDFEYTIKERNSESESFIEGVLYLLLINNKKRKIFSIYQNIDKQKELTALEVAKQLDFLRKEIMSQIPYVN